jgi:hypothetical protein
VGILVLTFGMNQELSRGSLPVAHNQRRSAPPATGRPREGRSNAPRALYLVLDDAGHDRAQLDPFFAFDGTFTVAVLPGLPASGSSAAAAVERGHEVILHQPMEAVGANDPGPGAIYVADDDATIRDTLTTNLALLPGVVGVNNHMGSRATSDPRVMRVVSETLGRYRLFLLDSRTTAMSVAAQSGRAAGVDTVVRDVFLDNERNPEYISDRLNEALALAETKGYAVMIGHVTSPELAAVLTERHAELQASGFVFYPLSRLVRGAARTVGYANTRY